MFGEIELQQTQHISMETNWLREILTFNNRKYTILNQPAQMYHKEQITVDKENKWTF